MASTGSKQPDPSTSSSRAQPGVKSLRRKPALGGTFPPGHGPFPKANPSVTGTASSPTRKTASAPHARPRTTAGIPPVNVTPSPLLARQNKRVNRSRPWLTKPQPKQNATATDDSPRSSPTPSPNTAACSMPSCEKLQPAPPLASASSVGSTLPARLAPERRVGGKASKTPPNPPPQLPTSSDRDRPAVARPYQPRIGHGGQETPAEASSSRPAASVPPVTVSEQEAEGLIRQLFERGREVEGWKERALAAEQWNLALEHGVTALRQHVLPGSYEAEALGKLAKGKGKESLRSVEAHAVFDNIDYQAFEELQITLDSAHDQWEVDRQHREAAEARAETLHQNLTDLQAQYDELTTAHGQETHLREMAEKRADALSIQLATTQDLETEAQRLADEVQGLEDDIQGLQIENLLLRVEASEMRKIADEERQRTEADRRRADEEQQRAVQAEEQASQWRARARRERQRARDGRQRALQARKRADRWRAQAARERQWAQEERRRTGQLLLESATLQQDSQELMLDIFSQHASLLLLSTPGTAQPLAHFMGTDSSNTSEIDQQSSGKSGGARQHSGPHERCKCKLFRKKGQGWEGGVISCPLHGDKSVILKRVER